MIDKIDKNKTPATINHLEDINYSLLTSRTSEESVYGHRGPPENLTMQDSWGNQLAWND